MFMRLFCCTAVVGMTGASMLHADALIPFATTQCTLNGVAAPCQVSSNPNPGASVFGFGSLSKPGVGASASTDIASGLTSASSFIKMDMWASTAGPVRAGFIDFVCGADSGGVGPGFPSSASISGAGGCSGPEGHSIGDHVPFTLGVPFEIILTAEARAHFDPSGGDQSGGSIASINFFVFDANNASVDVFGPLAVPEPAYLGGTAVALLGVGTLLRKRSRLA